MRLVMAKRGRPRGSKNKKKITKGLGKSVATMDIGQLRAHIEDLQGVLSKKVSEQRAYFEDQLAQLGGYVSRKASAAVKAVTPSKTGKRTKAAAKYRSRKEPKLTWSGRGMTAGWLKDEMKATGKPREYFAIK
jgi:DNA-binding protein H-NS